MTPESRTPRPFVTDMQQMVSCLEKRFGRVVLNPDDGYTKLVVRGVALTFSEAERLCLGQVKQQELRPA